MFTLKSNEVWLTVLTGISDPKLCLGSDVHSLHAVMCLPIRYKSKY